MIIMTLYQLVTVAIGFVVPKLLMSKYGATLHGYTSTVNNVMSYVALLNAGLATASVQSLYAPLAVGDKEKVSSTLKAVDRMYIKTGCYYMVAILGCAVVLPLVIKDQIPSITAFGLMITMGATNTLECFIYSKYRVLLQADQRLYIVTLGDIVALIIRGFLQVALISHGASIILVQAVSVLMVFIRMAFVSIYVHKNYTYIDSDAKPNYDALSKRKSAFVHQIASIVVNNTDVMILTVRGSLVSVSIYSVYNLVCTHINTLLSYVFLHGVVASFGQMLGEDRKERVLKMFRAYEYIYLLTITIVFSVTAAMLLPFVSLYTKSVPGTNYSDVFLVLLFVVVGLVNNLRIPCLTMINAAGMFAETQHAAVIEAILNICISLVLVNCLGMYGLLIGTIVSFLYRTVDIMVFTNHKILHQTVTVSIFRAVRVIFTVIINVLIINYALGTGEVTSWLSWGIVAVESTISASLVSVFIYVISEFKQTKDIVKTIKL